MKLNKIYQIVIIILIFIFHYFFQNGLEKIFFQTYFTFKDIKRPLNKCDNIFNTAVSCVGMPSGHAESATIVSVLLYSLKYISLPFCILLILVFSLQRIIVHMHTFSQIFVGILFGLFYSFIYITNHFSYKSLLIILSISFILISLIIHKLDQEIFKPIPEWVSSSMLSSIKKKQESPYYSKFIHIIANSIVQQVTFISWPQLETYLDIISSQIKETGIKYDAVIGIKTGGAILSDYLSQKLHIKNYKIKLSKEKFNCDKQPIYVVVDNMDRWTPNNYIDYMICEGIHDNLEGKNVILIDELVSSGNTISESYNYLKNTKKVNEIYVTSVALHKNRFKNLKLLIHFQIHHLLNNGVAIWPWGYDN